MSRADGERYLSRAADLDRARAQGVAISIKITDEKFQRDLDRARAIAEAMINQAADDQEECTLAAGHGPIVINELSCTTVVPPGWSVTLDAIGNIVMRKVGVKR